MKEIGIHYFTGAKLDMIGFNPSYWACDITNMKYTLGFLFMFGYGPMYWSSKKKETLSLSSVEAEYLRAMNGTI